MEQSFSAASRREMDLLCFSVFLLGRQVRHGIVDSWSAEGTRHYPTMKDGGQFRYIARARAWAVQRQLKELG